MLTLIGATSYGAVREPAVTGNFYPSDSVELDRMVTGHLDAVKELPEINGRILAIVVPHAGLIYSGHIAAYGYKMLEGRDIKNVIICGPSHHYRFDGLSVYGPFIKWKNPLGLVECNKDLCDKLISSDRNIELFRQAQLKEHSIEVQLPYLQKVLDDFEIVPIAMGEQSPKTIDLLTDALVSIMDDPGNVMVVSTDWQHYRPAEIGWAMDSLGIECLKELNPDRLQSYLSTGQVQLCGGGPAVAVIRAALKLGADGVKILAYGDSGDISGDKSKVVGYTAAVIYKAAEPVEPDKSEKTELESTPVPIEGKKLPDLFALDRENKRELLKIARKTLESYLDGSGIPDFQVSDNLKKFGAAFVTLEKNDQLRGCIGHITATDMLYKTVADCAVQAATEDPRFPPVSRQELDGLHIEISVMSPIQPVEDLNEIVVGRDGLMIFQGARRGLLLPQVATDYGWDREEFLEQTCRKAGLDKNAYKDSSAIIYKFQAVVFAE